MEDIIKIQIDAGSAVTELETVETAMNNLDTATQQTGEAAKGLKAQIREATNELHNMAEDDPRRAKLIADIGAMRDRMADNAEAIQQQTGPAIEGLNNSFGIMRDQMYNLDFQGLATSMQGVTANISRINTTDLTNGIKAFITAGLQGFKALAMVIWQNPIFLLIGVIVGIIAYWEELVALWNSSTLAALEKQLNNIKSQKLQTENMLAIEKARGKTLGETVSLQYKLLKLQQDQFRKEVEIARLNDEEEDTLKAQEELAKSIQAERELTATIEANVANVYKAALGYLDPAAKLQQEKEESVKAETEALLQGQEAINQQAIKQNDLNSQIAAQQALINTNLTRYDRIEDLYNKGIITEQQMLSLKHKTNQRGEKEIEANNEINSILQGKLNLLLQEKSASEGVSATLQQQLQTIQQAKDAKLATFKSEEQIKKEQEYQAKAEERKQKYIAKAKELKDEIASIEERIQYIGKTEREREFAELAKKQEEERKAFEKAKKSGDDMHRLKMAHETELNELVKKYADEIEKAEDEKLEKEKERAQKKLEFEIEMAAALEELQEANYQAGLSDRERELEAVQYHYQDMIRELERQGEDATNLKEEQRKKEDEINKKYNDKELADARALQEAKLDMISNGLKAFAELTMSFDIKNEKRAKKQFQINKALTMAAALIDTYKAVTSALADPNPLVPYYMKVANAVIAGTTGFAQVAKIAQTSWSNPNATGGGDLSGLGGGTGGGGGGMQAPPIDFSFMQQTGQPNTVETYVLAGNVANALEARQKIIDQSHL